MPITLAFDELLAYTDEEREKWNVWFRAQPPEIWRLPVQPGGRFPNVWSLLDHIVVVERRHLQRLGNLYPLPESTGVAEGRWDELWRTAQGLRGQLREYAAGLDESQANVLGKVQIGDDWAEVTPRKLLFHVLLHELRHWAQLALVFRKAGLNPPGDHDLVFSRVVS